jgi:hypothetical protein
LGGKVGADGHVGSATWAAPGGYLRDGDAWIGSRLAGKLKASQCEQNGSVSAGEIAEVADADKAPGQHMLAEATQELGSGESHDALLIATSIVSPSKAHAVTIEAEQALIADGDAVSVAAKIAQHVSRSAKSGLGIDHPIMF